MTFFKVTTFISVLLFSINSIAQQELTWEFYHPIKKEWYSFGRAGSIQEKLIASGALPDPFYGENEKEFQWIEDYVWQFRSTFYLTEKEATAESLLLNFSNTRTQ